MYRPTTVNGTTLFERITESTHFDVDPSFKLLDSQAEEACVGVPVLDVWSVKVGDIIGFRFMDFCVTESILLLLGIQGARVETVPVCPLYAGLTTDNVNDSAYFSPNLTTDNKYISDDDLSLISGVRLNIRAKIGKDNCFKYIARVTK